MRLRNIVLILGSLLVLAALLWTDPDKGLSTGMLMLGLVAPLVAVAVAHLVRKALFDYPEADLQRLFRTAGEGPTGSGLALIAVALVISALLGLFGRQAHASVRTEVPAAAMAHLPTLKAEQMSAWPDHPAPEVLGALVEHESCITLTHRRCWSPTASLRSQREEGAGLGQITRTWRPDGTPRFDALAEMRSRHQALREWSWSNVYSRPDLQLRAVVLLNRDNFQALRAVSDPLQRLAFADAAYNGGLGGVLSERRACHLKPGCNPQLWWGHVATTCLKSRAALYGGRDACTINRHHVDDVLLTRAPKYREHLS